MALCEPVWPSGMALGRYKLELRTLLIFLLGIALYKTYYYYYYTIRLPLFIARCLELLRFCIEKNRTFLLLLLLIIIIIIIIIIVRNTPSS